MPSKITPPNTRAIIVLGMHRSGTSALTRVLNLLGVYLGTRLLPTHATNETGFWEHFAIVNTNEQILQRVDSSWFDTAPLPDGWWTFKSLAPLRQYLREVLHQEFANRPLWGIKEPRLCRLLPLWIPLLENVLAERGKGKGERGKGKGERGKGKGERGKGKGERGKGKGERGKGKGERGKGKGERGKIFFILLLLLGIRLK